MKISREQIEFMKNASDHVDRLCGGRGYGKTHQLIKEMEDKINQLQSNWNSLREIISGNRRIYEDSNKSLEDSYKILKCDLPPRYYMNDGCIEMTDYLLDKMNELEGKDNN